VIGKTVYLVGGCADVYAKRADAIAMVAKIVRDETGHKLKNQDKEIVLHLLDAGKVELALHHFNSVLEAGGLTFSETEIR
jgi:hypothetical protein